MNQRDIGDVLRLMRRSKRLTQSDMANRMGLSQGRISQIEKEGPSKTQLMVDWAKACDVVLRVSWRSLARVGDKTDPRVRRLLYR